VSPAADRPLLFLDVDGTVLPTGGATLPETLEGWYATLVWIDDEVTGADRAWVDENHPGSALLHRVDPDEGLQGGDLDVVEAWLRGLSDGDAP